MDMVEYIREIHADYARKIEEFKQENSIMFEALKDIAHRANTFSEVQQRARLAFKQLDDICPLMKALNAQEAAEKATEFKGDAA